MESMTPCCKSPLDLMGGTVVPSVSGILNWLFDTASEVDRDLGIATSGCADNLRDCVLVLDASGSMLADDWPPTRLRAAQDSAVAFCTRVAEDEPQARVAIVAYGSRAKTCCGLTPAENQSALTRAIDGISCLGSTNIRGGLKEANELLARSSGPRQVVLLTDGHNTERDPLFIAKKLKRGTVVDCVGIGARPEDVDEELLRAIASEYPDGSKRYRWIGEKERLIRHFTELAGRISRS